MNLSELERQIADAHAEAITLAILGDQVGAQYQHNVAVELEQLRVEARNAELRFSTK